MATGSDEAYLCTHCGKRGYPVLAPRGHVFFEVILWVCYVVPGIIYSIWRRVRTKEVCPFCNHSSMVSSYSPKAKMLLALANVKEVKKLKNRNKLPVGAARDREKKYLSKKK
jgi:hypothetical protein